MRPVAAMRRRWPVTFSGWRRGSLRGRREMRAAHARYREQAAHAGLHPRTPGIVADLFIGWQRFLDFASEAEALTRGEAEVYRARVWSALIEVAHRQSAHHQEAHPVD